MRSAFEEYLKLTLSKSMEPSFTSVTAFSGLVRLLSSDSTSTIRSADSMDMVIITNTMDSIIKAHEDLEAVRQEWRTSGPQQLRCPGW